MKAIITGFDPFGGEKVNPAFEAVKLLPDVVEGCEIIKVEIPTVFYKSVDKLKEVVSKEKPDFVICVGQAGGRFNITPEAVAINKNEARIPDNDGQQPADEPVREDGKNAYFSTLPNKAIIKAMHDAGVPAQMSFTAGTYVCNHLFYGLMYMIEKDFPNMRGGFIHVPFSSQQAIDKKNTPHMKLEEIAKGLECALRATVLNKTDIELTVGDTH